MDDIALLQAVAKYVAAEGYSTQKVGGLLGHGFIDKAYAEVEQELDALAAKGDMDGAGRVFAECVFKHAERIFGFTHEEFKAKFAPEQEVEA